PSDLPTARSIHDHSGRTVLFFRGLLACSSVRKRCEHTFDVYVELHCHSAFSFLDGASLPDELVATACELGYQALALTDHNSVSGSMEFAVAARALGLRPIHGAEIDLEPDDSRAAQSSEAGCRAGRKREGCHLTLLVE